MPQPRAAGQRKEKLELLAMCAMHDPRAAGVVDKFAQFSIHRWTGFLPRRHDAGRGAQDAPEAAHEACGAHAELAEQILYAKYGACLSWQGLHN